MSQKLLDQQGLIRDLLTKHVVRLYEEGDGRSGGQKWKLHQARVIGVIDAAKALRLLSSEEVQIIIDEAHLSVFGQTRESRKAILGDLADRFESGDWDAFESPSYERNR